MIVGRRSKNTGQMKCRHSSCFLLGVLLLLSMTCRVTSLGLSPLLGLDERPFEHDPLYFSGPEGEQKYAQCLANLSQATKKSKGDFTRKAFLKFLELQSDGRIKETNFNSSIIRFVHVYSVVTCTVNPTGCTSNKDPVSLNDILNYNDPSGDNLGFELCERVDIILNDMFTQAPTQRTPSMNAPTKSPSRRPSPSPTVSNAPSQAPTFGDYFSLTFSIEYTVDNPKVVIETWSNSVIESVLASEDPRCVVGGTSCPFTFSSKPLVIDRCKLRICVSTKT